jgi:hypothetical protein
MRRPFLPLLLALPLLAAGGSTAIAAPAAPPPLVCTARDCLLPFPSDAYTRSDPTTGTGLRVDFPVTAMPRNAAGVPVDPAVWNRNDGFSPGSMILAHVPGLDLVRTGAAPSTDIGRSLRPDAPIVLLDTRTGARVPYWAELDANATDPTRQALIVRPARNFTEGRRYAVLLRNLRDATGAAIPAATSWPSNGARALRELRRHGVRTTGAYLAWDFTVASERGLTGGMLHMRDEAFRALGGKAPTAVVTGTADYTPSQDPVIARKVTGYVTVPSYLDLPGGPPGSGLHYGPRGLPEPLPGNTQAAAFECNIPRAAFDTPARPSLYGHGLLGTTHEIDALKPYSGQYDTMFCATPWIGMAQEDIPNVVSVFEDFSRFNTVPDRSQQSFLDFLFLGRALSHPHGLAAQPAFQDVAGHPLFDPRGLVYMGNSQGGILGGAVTAIAQDWTKSLLGVPAMNYSTLLNRSADFDPFQALENTTYPDKIDQQVLFALLQMLWDRGEADGYVAHLTSDPLPGTPRHRVLLMEAFGDHQVSNVATEVEARTLGLPVHQPALTAGRSLDVVPYWGLRPIPRSPYAGSALVVWDSGTPPAPPVNLPNRAGHDPHGDPRRAPAALAMTAYFFNTGEILDTCASAPCTAPSG